MSRSVESRVIDDLVKKVGIDRNEAREVIDKICTSWPDDDPCAVPYNEANLYAIARIVCKVLKQARVIPEIKDPLHSFVDLVNKVCELTHEDRSLCYKAVNQASLELHLLDLDEAPNEVK